MPSMFEFLDSINTGTKLDLTVDEALKDYVPFQINNGLSQHLDTVLLANEMNKRPWLSKEMQFKFLSNVVTKKRRYGKWAKADVVANQADIDMISEYYSINNSRAVEYIKVLKFHELELIRQWSDKGGSATLKKGKK